MNDKKLKIFRSIISNAGAPEEVLPSIERFIVYRGRT
jgi:hypothetical protein